MMKRLTFLSLLFFAPACFAQSVCALNTTSVGWTWNCPQLGLSWAKINLLSKVDDTDVQSAGSSCTGGANCYTQFKTKYGATGGNWANWETAMSTRMTSMGFTGAGFASPRFKQYWVRGNLPFEFAAEYGGYAIRDATNGITGVAYHVKDAGWIDRVTATKMKCGANYYKGLSTPDPYDPEFSTAYNALYARAISLLGSSSRGMLMFMADDGDYLATMNLVDFPNSHADYGLIIASQNPVQGKSSANAGGTYTFSNKTYFAKQALRDWLLNEYLCTGAGAPVATCTGAGTGTGSADPSSGSYVGATAASTALAAFNTAWSESSPWRKSYTTWNTSDSGGLAGIASGAYASYGTGTGFLDEDGSTLVGISCSGTSGNGPQQNQNWAIVPRVQADVDHWMAFGFAATWASEIWTAYSAACGSNCPPLAIPSYDGPHTPEASSVYAGMATAFAGHSVVFWTSTPTAVVTQDIINHDGNMPVILLNYAEAQPDSFVVESPNYKDCTGKSAINCQNTQALRGAEWVAYNSASLRLQNPAGKYAVVGFEHWAMYDSYSQGGDFGICTDNDNCYDGSSASTATSSGSCATSTGYTIPAICQDSNGNYESLSLGPSLTTCTSGSTGPTWATGYGAQTADGTCTWFNGGPYSRNVESSTFGNSMLPVVTFNLSNLADQ